MLLRFLYPLHTEFGALNVLKYITFRTLGATITAVLLSMLFGDAFIRALRKRQIGQEIRDDGPQSHLSKKGTPTMGGALILFSVTVSTLLWSDWNNLFVWIALLTTLAFGAIGFLDDAKKVFHRNTKGLSAKQKLGLQWLIALVASTLIFTYGDFPPTLRFPFLKNFELELGFLFIPFASFVIVGCSNAVNLTDGLDGLAVGPTITTAGAFAVLAYCAGHAGLAEYLQIPHIAEASELPVFLGAVAASCLGFLWFNTYPAQVFMGDMGSLSLGAALGTCAVLTRNEILLAICGGIFVIEALSVMAQVASFKLTGKRIFKMAPIHHHFELKGWAEPKVIVRFWIISFLLALITISTLKLR